MLDQFAQHMDEHWPLVPSNVLAMPNKSRLVPRGTIGTSMGSRLGTKVPEQEPTGAARYHAVHRWLKNGSRLIPDGPSVAEFVDHRKHIAVADASLGISSASDAYSDYVMMCDLGGWEPEANGHAAFMRCLRNLGYPERRQRNVNGRPRMIDFNLPPEI